MRDFSSIQIFSQVPEASKKRRREDEDEGRPSKLARTSASATRHPLEKESSSDGSDEDLKKALRMSLETDDPLAHEMSSEDADLVKAIELSLQDRYITHI